MKQGGYIVYFPYMREIALSLGTNSGDRFYFMRAMEDALKSLLNAPLRRSALFETEPVDVAHEQPWFLNRIVSGFFEASAEDLLECCNTIERSLGRANKGKRTERTSDIDILLFGNEVITRTHLTIPHGALLDRRFCLEGLFQIIPDAEIPPTGKSVAYHYHIMKQSVQEQRIRTVTREESV